jgi:hypothetical protein
MCQGHDNDDPTMYRCLTASNVQELFEDLIARVSAWRAWASSQPLYMKEDFATLSHLLAQGCAHRQELPPGTCCVIGNLLPSRAPTRRCVSGRSGSGDVFAAVAV